MTDAQFNDVSDDKLNELLERAARSIPGWGAVEMSYLLTARWLHEFLGNAWADEVKASLKEHEMDGLLEAYNEVASEYD